MESPTFTPTTSIVEVFPTSATSFSEPVPIPPLDFSLGPSLVTPSRTRRRSKKNTADNSIRRLCASHQGDIELLCDLWSSPSQSLDLSSPKQPTREEDEAASLAEMERQRLLQLEMQLMRMQLQQAELSPPSLSSRSVSFSEPKPTAEVAAPAQDEPPYRKPDLRIPLEDDLTQSVQIAQEEQQNLLWAEADYRAQKRGRNSGSKPTTPTAESPLDSSDLCSVSPTSLEFVNAPLYEGYVKMPRGVLCKFWCAKKRFCVLDSARCLFYWKSKEQSDSGRAKCFNGVTGGVPLPGDDKSIELSYAGGSCVVLLKCDTTQEAQRLLMALASLESDSWNLRMHDVENSGIESVSLSKLSNATNPPTTTNQELVRRAVARMDCNNHREVIQNAFLDEYRKKQQFEQLLRANSKSTSTSPCAARECHISPLVLRVH